MSLTALDLSTMAAGLSDNEIRAIGELMPEIGTGPTNISAWLRISKAEARRILRRLGMSIASDFRAKYDVALASADETIGKDADHRRTKLMQAIDAAGLRLVEMAYVKSLFDEITKLRTLHVAGNGQVLTMADVEQVTERLERDHSANARDDAVRLIRFLAAIKIDQVQA